ncbi:ribonuclease J [Brevibacillus sp. FSL K6-0770]|uniref:ribonuclease J1 n=1 Tax=Brevibacillus TaxID=55080 RepID=UPI001C22A37A|nr:ribonuclease J [Brevibacillus parabrevis]MBU8715701.1 ribonuclease J [Brevibacillus parabrevis]
MKLGGKSLSDVKIFAMGGLGEIGKNMYCVEYEDEIIIIDCGVKFPENEMFGIDLVIPDISYLVDNQHKIKALLLTHGHEDHIGAIPYIFKQINVPIYGGRLTLGLVKAKLEEHRMQNDVKMIPISEDTEIPFNLLKATFFRTNHSIPDSLGVVLHTPEGMVIHTGDFKFDMTPVGQTTEYGKIAKLGASGDVLALLSDSTNSERYGFTMSERTVGEGILDVVRKARGRIILATFASNVHRLQQVVDAAEQCNRKVAVIGRSMEKVFLIGQELGYIQMPEGMLIDIKHIDNYADNQVLIICTGSQGEPMAALTRIASGSHRTVSIYPEDTVIISASPIPGNTINVSRTIDKLYRAGANVVLSHVFDIHASGHGSSEELKLMLNFIRPKYFIPIHGEYRMLKTHSKLAQQVGIDESNIFLMDNGEVLNCNREKAWLSKVHAGIVLIDGSGIGDVGNIVLRDRKHLAEDGLMVVVVSLDMKNFKILTGPDIVSRGFVYVRGSESLIQEATLLVRQRLQEALDKKIKEWSELKSQINEVIKPFIYEKTGRNPMILTILMEV